MPTTDQNADRLDAADEATLVSDARIEEVAAVAREEGRAAADRVLAKYVKGATTAFVILLLAVLYVGYSSYHSSEESRNAIVTSGKVVSVDGCNRDFDTAEGLLAVLTRGEVFIVAQHKDGQISDAALKAGLAYYAEQKQNIVLPDCREVAKIITDDPRKTKYPPPFPQYPGQAADSSTAGGTP